MRSIAPCVLIAVLAGCELHERPAAEPAHPDAARATQLADWDPVDPSFAGCQGG